MHRRPAVALVALALMTAALLAGCGGGDSGPAATGIANGVAGVPDGAAFVDQTGLRFRPDTLTTTAGETVYFKNSEPSLHTVTINGKNESGSMNRREVFVWTPASAGTYQITCDFHPQMKATLTVE